MKRISCISATLSMVFAMLCTVSCTNNPRTTDNNAIAAEITEQNKDAHYNEKDARFLITMAELNLEEIQLGQLAQKNGSTQAVRDLGKMMEEAHSISFNNLTILAQNKVVTIPTALNDNSSAFFDKMSRKNGMEFDKEYSMMMVNEHKKSIEELEIIAVEAHDPDIRQWASNTLPVLKEHLEHAVAVQDTYK